MSWLVLLAGVALVGGGAWAMDRFAVAMLRPPGRREEREIAELPFPHRVVEIPAPGVKRLRGWLFEPGSSREEASAAILAHGWNATGGRMIELARRLLEEGHPVLVFDVRGHGESEGDVVTVRHFRDDVDAAARCLRERFPGRRRFVAGHSMGGAAAILAAADGAPLHGVVALGAPADVLEATAEWLRARGLPGGLLVRLMMPFWRARIREPTRRLVPGRRARELDGVPVLIVQGDEDERVPLDDARLLAGAAGGELLLVEGADHNGILDRADVADALARFARGLDGPRDREDRLAPDRKGDADLGRSGGGKRCG